MKIILSKIKTNILWPSKFKNKIYNKHHLSMYKILLLLISNSFTYLYLNFINIFFTHSDFLRLFYICGYF